MKTCLTCKWHKSIQPQGPLSGTPWWFLTEDVAACSVEKLVDPVDGKPTYRRCAYMRSDKGPCGQEGRLWKRRRKD